MDNNILHVILAAGSGSRLFPLSTKTSPKQFVKLENEYSLLQNTILRLSWCKELVITTMEKYLDTLIKQLNELKLDCKYTIVIVPENYNTAYSICAVANIFKDRKLIVLPSDKIFVANEFAKLLFDAGTILNNDPTRLLFFGKVPTYPSVEFGYLLRNGDRVEKFVEKPNMEVAIEYFKNKNYYWNGGIIGFHSPVLIQKYETFRKDILDVCKNAVDNSVKCNNLIILKKPSDNEVVEDISIDYAVNEKLQMHEMSFIPFNCKWADIGSWNSVHAVLDKDDNGINRPNNYKALNSKDCLILAQKPIYLNGVSNLIVIETDECIMISHRDKVHDIKKLVNS